MIPFVYGDEERAKMRGLLKYAEEHRIDHETMLKLVAGEDIRDEELRMAGKHPFTRYSAELQYGFSVTFTIEDHGHSNSAPGWMRHMSMSLQKEGRVPHVLAVEMVMPDLGFRGGVDASQSRLEDIAPGHKAVNILQPYYAS